MATDKRYFWRNDDPLWYKDAIIYELHVRAFHDSDGDGIGDFAGLTQKLDYLQDLGITAIWLLPFYPSPFRDDGYDVSDYTGVHPSYGTIRDVRELIREANYRGLRVITEMILNHTSDQHPWFQRSRRSAPGSPGRDFYVWSNTRNKYQEARIIFKDFEISNWTWDPLAESYYWHRFYSHQPDLNFNKAHVRQAIFRVMDFWLRMGVSGFRLDAVPYLYELEGTNCENLPQTHAFIRELRQRTDEKFQNRMLLAEANQWSEDAVAYFGSGDECHMAYHFPLMPRMFMAIRMEDRFPIVDILRQTPPIPEICQWALFLRNHDELTLEMVTDEERDYMYRVYAQDTQARINLGIRRRLAPLLNNDRKKIELMNGLLFSLPGTPLIYYGDEIGMGDNMYLGDRNGVRTPMQWSADRNAGFSRANPQRLYLPVNIDPEYHYEACNVETQQNNPDSLLWWMKRLIAARKRFKAFGRGSLEFIQPENRKILAFIRRYENEIIMVVANLSRHAQHTGLNLSELGGMVPVEIFGQAEFPVIGESPYQLTLGPYSFYWFALEAARPERILLDTPEKVLVPTLSPGEWDNLYKRRWKPSLEAALLNYVRQRRWFASKTRRTTRSEIVDVITVPYDTREAYFNLLKIEYSEDEPDTYLLPITFALDEEATRIAESFPQAVIANLSLNSKDAEKKGLIYDAMVEQDFHSALLKAIEKRRRFRGQKGELVTNHTKNLFRKLREPVGKILESSLLLGEQSNTSVTYGDRFKFKLFRRLEDGISPELEVGRFLTEKEPFTHTAPVAGAMEYKTRWKEPVTLGILHGYVHNEGDAWHYTLDSLGRYFEEVLANPGTEVPLPATTSLLDIVQESVPQIFSDTIGPYLAMVQLLGQRTAEMHLTLASAVDEPNFVPEPFSVTYQRALSHSMRGFAMQVLQLLRRRVRYLPDDIKADARNVLGMETAIIERYEAITRQRITAMRIRNHGDYHLGQVLYTGNDFIIVDFEGEPARRLGERRIKRSPLRDVAGMVRSFHYATHVALYGQASTVPRPEDLPALEEWGHCWYLWVASSFLKSYLEMMADSPVLPQSNEGMKIILNAYLLDKAIYEVNYELNNRPDWVKLPLLGILQVLQNGEKPEKITEEKGESVRTSAEMKKKSEENTPETGRKTKKKAEE